MNIDMRELLSKMSQENLTVVDIRDKYKYNMGHIPTAINIPANYLLINPTDYLEKEKTYYIYCQVGHVSNDLVRQLNYLGYHTISVIGGYNSYKICRS